MEFTLKSALTAALVMGLGACASEKADNSAVDANAVKTEAVGSDTMKNDMMADASNPFAKSEMEMSEKMMTAVGANIGDNWVRKMIEHHQGAVDMSRIVLQQHPSADAAKMAQNTIDKQTKEIAELRKLLQPGGSDQQSARVYSPAMMSMHEAMMGAKGRDVSETFLRKMLEHHKGAIAMSDVALKNGVSGELRAEVEKTRADQIKESKMVQAMLRGEPMSKAMAEAGVMPPSR